MLSSFILPALLGLLIGIFSGMLGIGGGTIMVPTFRLFFKMSALMSAATSLFVIIPTSIAGVISHARQKTIHIPLGLTLGFAGACASPFGVYLASISPDLAIMLVTALVIGYSAFSMLKKAIAMKPGDGAGLQEKLKKEEPCAAEEEEEKNNLTTASPERSEGQTQGLAQSPVRLNRSKVAIAVIIGLVAGLLSGYVGIGGGFIMVPLMVLYIEGIDMKRASGTSLAAIVILAIPGVIKQALLGNVNYMVGIAVALGSMPGAFLGARLVKYIPERTLRFIFSIFLGIAAILLVVYEFIG